MFNIVLIDQKAVLHKKAKTLENVFVIKDHFTKHEGNKQLYNSLRYLYLT